MAPGSGRARRPPAAGGAGAPKLVPVRGGDPAEGVECPGCADSSDRAAAMDSPPPTTPGVHTPGSPNLPPRSRRSAQLALAAFLAVLVGLLVFRGYGNRLGARPSEPAPVARVDLNRADHTELEQVPGLGPKLARAIEDHRREKGPFRSVEELRGVHGVGPATVEKVRPFVRVESDPA